MKRRTLGIIMMAIAMTTLAGIGLVESARSHPPGPMDSDPAVGFSLGAGDLDCDGSACDGPQGALGAEFHLGPKLEANLVLLGDVWLMADTGGADEISQVLLTGAIQWWPVYRFWLRFGVGAAHADFRHESPVFATEKAAWEPAIMAGAGVELVSTPSFALDLQLLYGRGFHDDADLRMQSLSIGLGLDWY